MIENGIYLVEYDLKENASRYKFYRYLNKLMKDGDAGIFRSTSSVLYVNSEKTAIDIANVIVNLGGKAQVWYAKPV